MFLSKFRVSVDRGVMAVVSYLKTHSNSFHEALEKEPQICQASSRENKFPALSSPSATRGNSDMIVSNVLACQ